MKHEFLSVAWIDAARTIRDEYQGRIPPVAVSVRLNQIVLEVPGGTEIHAHVDTSQGRLSLELGHLEKPDLTITIDYATARALFVEQDAQVAMKAFFEGKIKLDGDPSKLMMLQMAQAQQTSDLAAEIARRVLDITAD